MELKRYLIIVLVFFNMIDVIAQSFDLESIDEKLNKIYDNDQQIREKMSDAIKNKLNIREIIAEMDSVDLYNQQYISKVLEAYGWPINLSERANRAIWIVIDHANNIFAEKYFHLVMEKGEQGILQMSDVATLEDRILMKNNKKQKYGTQTVSVLYADTSENIIYIWPVENNEKVDELRASVGLPTMNYYLQDLEKYPNVKVIWNKKMSLDDLKKELPMLYSK